MCAGAATLLIAIVATSLVIGARSARADQKVTRTFEAAPDVTVVVSNPFGRVQIEGWSRPEVELKAKVKGDLDIDAERDSIEIEVDFSFSSLFRGAEGDIELKVPMGAEIEVNGVGTRIDVKNVTGELRLETIQGDIRVDAPARNARLSTISGEIRFRGSASDVHAQSISGSIRLEGVGANLEVESTSGEIRIDSGAIEHGSLQTISGEIRMKTRLLPGARLDVETLSAPIRLSIPRNSSTRLNLESASGEVRSKTGEGHERSHRGSRLDITLGEGDGRVRLQSFSGEIRVEER